MWSVEMIVALSVPFTMSVVIMLLFLLMEVERSPALSALIMGGHMDSMEHFSRQLEYQECEISM